MKEEDEGIFGKFVPVLFLLSEQIAKDKFEDDVKDVIWSSTTYSRSERATIISL
ncbi:hypothetical protein F511_01479 [Dorcoceras hygrometricum]|uniref:Uncharacterized protein n=1 Tax=Dorcoceras hygrometricum TaxID=472368 RepID=A0A2Z7BLH0_9LAMI|nr:hypothetical protein F511_01479 [Dorcoceras hygrometricum]